MWYLEPNILLIVCDTLRKDVLEVYGGPAKTPNLRKLALDSIVYENCIASSPWTYPSHVSLFTGQYLYEHHVHEVEHLDLKDLFRRYKTLKSFRLPERLSKLGYNTTGISNNAWVSTQTGFGVGFDSFFALDTEPRWIGKSALNRGSVKKNAALNLLETRKFNRSRKFVSPKTRKELFANALSLPIDKGAYLTNNILFNERWDTKFFRFVNFTEAHEPYISEDEDERWRVMIGSEKPNPRTAARLKKQYIYEAEYLDVVLGDVVETLKLKGVYDNTMIVIVGDHGQAFNEHGFMYHGVYLYDELSRVPLIIKYPRSRKFKAKKGYQSLVSIPRLIDGVINNEDDSQLYTSSAFSESYGFPHSIPERYKSMEKSMNEDFTKSRVAIYKDGFKLTFNTTDEKVEEFLKNGLRVSGRDNHSKIRELLEEYNVVQT